MKEIVFFDIEVNPENGIILDIGAVNSGDLSFHKNSIVEFANFIRGTAYVCGHNILTHDIKYLQNHNETIRELNVKAIDTLLLSPLLFPKSPYHKLLKDDKLQIEERNNPLNDSKKARDLFYDEITAFNALDDSLKTIFFNLLETEPGFTYFFEFVEYSVSLSASELEKSIKDLFRNSICDDIQISSFISESPVPLSYALS